MQKFQSFKHSAQGGTYKGEERGRGDYSSLHTIASRSPAAKGGGWVFFPLIVFARGPFFGCERQPPRMDTHQRGLFRSFSGEGSQWSTEHSSHEGPISLVSTASIAADTPSPWVLCCFSFQFCPQWKFRANPRLRLSFPATPSVRAVHRMNLPSGKHSLSC